MEDVPNGAEAKDGRGTRALAHLFILAALSLVVVGRGGQVAVVGLLVANPSPGFHSVVAALSFWLGALAFIFSAAIRHERGLRFFAGLGALLLLSCWGLSIPISELPVFTFMTGVPFASGAVARLVLSFRPGGRRGDPIPRAGDA